MTDENPRERLSTALDRLDEEGPPGLANQLAQLLTAVVQEAARRKRFANELNKALGARAPDKEPSKQATKRPHRRVPAVLDPFAAYEDGEHELRRQLRELDVEQLKDIIAEHGMDRDRLAMKWKTPERLIERIVETVRSRSAKGDVFMR